MLDYKGFARKPATPLPADPTTKLVDKIAFTLIQAALAAGILTILAGIYTIGGLQ